MIKRDIFLILLTLPLWFLPHLMALGEEQEGAINCLQQMPVKATHTTPAVGCNSRGGIFELPVTRGIDQLASNMGKLDRALFVQRIKSVALKEIIENGVLLQYRYSDHPVDPASFIGEICGGSCDQQTYTELLAHGQKFIKQLTAKKIARSTTAQTADLLNSRIEELNRPLLESAELLNSSALGRQGRVPVDQLPPEVQHKFQQYQQRYWELLGEAPGTLLLTPSLRLKTGKVRQLDRDLKYRGVGRSGRPGWKKTLKHRITPHRLLKDRVYRGRRIEDSRGHHIFWAIKQAKEQLTDFGKKVLDSDGSGKGLKGIKQLLQLVPATVGRGLGQFKEGRLDVCQALAQLESDHQSSDYWRKKGEQAILALDLASLGMLGAALPTYGVSLLPVAAAQGAKLAIRKLLSYGIKVGSGALTAELGLSGHSAITLSQRHDDLIGGYLSDTRHEDADVKMEQLAKETASYRIRTLFAAFGLINIGTLGRSIHRIGKGPEGVSKANKLPTTKTKATEKQGQSAFGHLKRRLTGRNSNPYLKLKRLYRGQEGKRLMLKYNPGNRFQLRGEDRLYYVGLADLLEQELKQQAKYRRNPALLTKEVRTQLDDFLKKCRE